MQEMWIQSLGQEDPLEKEIETHFSVLGWEIPWTEEPVRLTFLHCAYLLSHVQLFVTPWTVAHKAPLSMGFLQARKLVWVAMLFSRGSS